MFHDAAEFGFTEILEAHWQQIRDEYHGIRDRLVDWHETDLYGHGWSVFGLFDFPHGTPITENMAACPVTASLIEQHVPGHGAAGFSMLAAGTRVRPHQGYAGPFLRCHLALSVPDGDVGLRVGSHTQRWTEGRVLIFDDRVDHEAWNLATGRPADRVVLLIDFIPSATD
ncbi:MAG: aspartyl/asparaginyl beta-hydroxylase domain-containing protein [Fuerstiella sp.]